MQEEEKQNNGAASAAELLFPALCRAIVVDPSSVEVDVRHGTASSTVAAHPGKVEAGNLIGRNGRAVSSFKLLAKMAGARWGWPVAYEVEVGPGTNPAGAQRPEPASVPWDGEWVESLLLSVLSACLNHPAEVVRQEFDTHTAFEVVLDADEPVPDVALAVVNDKVAKVVRGDEAVESALNTVFKAVGKVRGRTVGVTYLRRGRAAQEQQPATAAGRYAGETT